MTHHSRPDSWLEPRPYTDPELRRHKHGKLLPMEYPPHPAIAAVKGLAIMALFFALVFGFALVTP